MPQMMHNELWEFIDGNFVSLILFRSHFSLLSFIIESSVWLLFCVSSSPSSSTPRCRKTSSNFMDYFCFSRVHLPTSYQVPGTRHHAPCTMHHTTISTIRMCTSFLHFLLFSVNAKVMHAFRDYHGIRPLNIVVHRLFSMRMHHLILHVKRSIRSFLKIFLKAFYNFTFGLYTVLSSFSSFSN